MIVAGGTAPGFADEPAATGAAPAVVAAPTPPPPAEAAPAPFDLAQALAERSLGDPKAPVVMVEFSSLTCPHCAAFHAETLPELKTRYIDTGKLRLIQWDFPLDRAALFAALLARCAPPERYFGFIDVLFKTQSRWARSSDPMKSLAQIGQLGGVPKATFDACVEDKALIEGVVKLRMEAEQKYAIKSTPTFVFNGGDQRLDGALPVAKFVETIEALLPK
ncbi:MAG: thioredoxin domain-containing protein [Azospirillum sp.]|nr:thioredoxin domain-containing protein [Azospirillum sp.]